MFPSVSKDKALVLFLAKPMVIVLFLLSSRTPISLNVSLAYDGKRPRSSRQELPVNQAREEARQSESDRHGGPGSLSDLTTAKSFRSTRFHVNTRKIAAELTKPAYLKFFETTTFQNYLSPPA